MSSGPGHHRFAMPPGWPAQAPDWVPPDGWEPDPAWGPAPYGWTFWQPMQSDQAPVPPDGPQPLPPMAAASANLPYQLPDVHPDAWYQKRRVVIPIFALLIIGVLALAGALQSGSDYSGSDLQADVERTLRDNGASGDIVVNCPDVNHVASGVIVDCRAHGDGQITGIRVTFDDDKGHFTLQQESLP